MSTEPYAHSPSEKSNTLGWITTAIVAFLTLIILAIGAGFLHRSHKDKPAGNSLLATVRLAAALNKDIEVVSIDEDHARLAYRDKLSGKTHSITFEQAKNGQWAFGEDDSPVAASTNGKSGAVPDWLPDYPGSEPKRIFSATTVAGSSGSYTFLIGDSIEKVATFYEDGFRSLGFKVDSNLKTGEQPGGMITIDSGPRMATVMLDSEGGKTGVSVTFTNKTSRR